MDESTTRKLSDVLSGIDNTKDMEKFMEEPKVIDSFKNFPDYFRSLSAVQQLESGELIQRSGLERSFYYHCASRLARSSSVGTPPSIPRTAGTSF